MKQYFATVAFSSLFFLLTGCLTPVTIPSEEQKYSVVHDIKGVNKNELFSRANTWFVSKFVNANSVIQYSDKENGKIAGKYYSELTAGVFIFGVRQTIEVDVRDEKVRIMFHSPTSISLGNAFGAAQGKGPTPIGNWKNIVLQEELTAIYNDWKKLGDSLKVKLNTNDSF